MLNFCILRMLGSLGMGVADVLPPHPSFSLVVASITPRYAFNVYF